ncbi:probable exported protein YPO4070 [Brenneria goodwinii]|uniref:Probable exported protein YPO4070 n=2 Tax=Brenneria goodwinii TaxID=1109412 RepID=A0A0G4JTQ5_9GAMM|nr:probable exported protein YPO4070 [Brenneria goodwinii]
MHDANKKSLIENQLQQGDGMKGWMEYRSRWLLPVLMFFMALQLTACGDSEADQRKAFIDFLQTVHLQQDGKLPALSEEQKTKFGPFVDDYAILTTFSQQLNQAVAGSLMPMLTQVSQIRVPQDYLLQRDNLRQSIGAINQLGQQIQEAKAQADNALRMRKQPEELQVIYGRLYAQVVTQPTNVLLPTIPSALSFIQSLIQVGDYLEAQGNQAVFNGNSVQFPTQQQVAQYNSMVSGLAIQQQNLMNALKPLNGSANR